MKILKMIGMLFAVCFFTSIKTMMPVQDEFAFERQFLQGNISSDEYLSRLAIMYPDYAYKIRALRNMQGINSQVSVYTQFLRGLDTTRAIAQRFATSKQFERYNSMIRSMRDDIKKGIDTHYKDLDKGIYIRYGRES